MTLTMPLRFTILHFWHRFLTEARTFIFNPQKEPLFKAISNPAPAQVIRRKLHHYCITRQNLNKVNPHFA